MRATQQTNGHFKAVSEFFSILIISCFKHVRIFQRKLPTCAHAIFLLKKFLLLGQRKVDYVDNSFQI